MLGGSLGFLRIGKVGERSEVIGELAPNSVEIGGFELRDQDSLVHGGSERMFFFLGGRKKIIGVFAQFRDLYRRECIVKPAIYLFQN